MRGEVYTEARKLAGLYLRWPHNCQRVEWFAFERTPSIWLPFDNANNALDVLGRWQGKPCVARVDALSLDKYYGSTVTVCAGGEELPPEGRSAALRWTIWEAECPNPSARQCDALGMPHGTTVAEANKRYDAYLDDGHHETQLCYQTCYLLAQTLRGIKV